MSAVRVIELNDIEAALKLEAEADRQRQRAEILLTALRAASAHCFYRQAGICYGGCRARDFCKTDGLQVLDYPPGFRPPETPR